MLIFLTGFVVIHLLSKFEPFQKAAKIFIISLFCFSLGENILIGFRGDPTPFSSKRSNNLSYNFKNSSNIYFFLLDAYAGSSKLKSNIGFDNFEFINYFKNKGFIVSENAYSNYPNTSTSLTSSFSMDYINESDVNQNDILSPELSVFSTLKNNNYKFVILHCHYDFLSGKRSADITMRPSNSFLFTLSNINFLRTTIFMPFQWVVAPYLYHNKDNINNIFNVELYSPKFVYIHFLQTHDFAYDKNCNIKTQIRKVLPSPDEFKSNHCCLNSLVEESVNEILEHDPNSIIIVQGDHGPSWWRTSIVTPKSGEEFGKMFSIFSAIYIPDLDKDTLAGQYLSGSPSPVNNFRIIFAHLANKPVKLLPDRHFSMTYQEVTHLKPKD